MSLTLRYLFDKEVINISINTFPAGETYVTLDDTIEDSREFEIVWDYENDSELFTLGLIMQTVSQNVFSPSFVLNIPYFPHARMDRITSSEMSFSLNVVAETIKAYSKSFNINYIETLDLHSKALDSLLEYIEIVDIQKEELLDIPEEELVLLSPDEGAWEKTNHLAYYLEASRMEDIKILKGSKKRDPSTGNITGFKVESLCDKQVSPETPIYLVDDICDGGGTFLGIYQEIIKLYPENPIHLWTTHGIYSKGLEPLEECFDSVSCHYLLKNSKGI